MKVIDMHCDTIGRLFYEPENNSLRRSSFHVDLEKLLKGGYLLQNFALFVESRSVENPLETALAMADLYYQELEKNTDIICPVFSYEDIEENQKNGRISAMLTLEEGAVLKGSLSNLRNFFRLGVRMIALTWNYENEIGAPNLRFDENKMPLFSERNPKGLTEFGIETILEMERLGMIIDVSHLSDGGFWDIVRHTKKPFVASHSNAASECGVCRNLTDEMIRTLAERGGVTGLNFCTDFLCMPQPETLTAFSTDHSDQTDSAAKPVPVSRIQDIVRHIRHITNVGGIDVCALGSDFDGISNDLEFTDASGIGRIADALKKDGFSENDIEKIFYKNILRIYRETLPHR